MKRKWGDKVRFDHKTEQQCVNCKIVKAVHHEPHGAFTRDRTEFWQGEEQVHGDGRTPVCEAVGLPGSSTESHHERV